MPYYLCLFIREVWIRKTASYVIGASVSLDGMMARDAFQENL